MLKINNKTILKATRKFVEYTGADIHYTECVNYLKRIKDLNKISDTDIKEIIDFLVVWKCRGLVSSNSENKKKYLNQVGRLKKVLKNISEKFKGLKNHNLKDISIKDKEFTIRTIYKNIREAKFGATATSKIMHIFNPNLFVMWDEAIRTNKYYNCRSATPNQYVKFMKKIQKICKRLNIKQKELKITIKRKPTLVKMIDEANYMGITRDIPF